MSRDERFRRWARDMCWHLKLAPPFTPEMFVQAVAELLDCQIQVIEHDLEGSTLYGFCLALQRKFLIAVRQDTSLDHRERIIYHEVSHILLRHVTLDGSMQACRELDEFEETEPQERDAEDAARALASFAHSERPRKRKNRTDDSGLETFWDEMGSDK